MSKGKIRYTLCCHPYNSSCCTFINPKQLPGQTLELNSPFSSCSPADTVQIRPIQLLWVWARYPEGGYNRVGLSRDWVRVGKAPRSQHCIKIEATVLDFRGKNWGKYRFSLIFPGALGPKTTKKQLTTTKTRSPF